MNEMQEGNAARIRQSGPVKDGYQDGSHQPAAEKAPPGPAVCCDRIYRAAVVRVRRRVLRGSGEDGSVSLLYGCPRRGPGRTLRDGFRASHRRSPDAL